MAIGSFAMLERRVGELASQPGHRAYRRAPSRRFTSSDVCTACALRPGITRHDLAQITTSEGGVVYEAAPTGP